MTVCAAAIRKMVCLGLDAAVIADLCEIIEAGQKIVPSALENRRAYDRERKAEKRKSGGIPVDTISDMSGGKSGGIPPDQGPSRVRDINPSLVISGKKEDTQEANASFVGQKRKSTRRCPADWLPSVNVLATADTEGFTSGEIERELAKFRDHQFRDGHTDWDASFRNWLRNANDRNPRRANGHSPKFKARQANLARALGGADHPFEYFHPADG